MARPERLEQGRRSKWRSSARGPGAESSSECVSVISHNLLSLQASVSRLAWSAADEWRRLAEVRSELERLQLQYRML